MSSLNCSDKTTEEMNLIKSVIENDRVIPNLT